MVIFGRPYWQTHLAESFRFFDQVLRAGRHQQNQSYDLPTTKAPQGIRTQGHNNKRNPHASLKSTEVGRRGVFTVAPILGRSVGLTY